MDDYSEYTGIFFPPKVKRHLRPFYPYLEKEGSTHALEHRAPEVPHGINLETLKTWIKTCMNTHGNHCSNRNASAFGKPVWLIDVVRACLVPADTHCYLALSYVWGAVECASLTLDTLEALQGHESLAKVSIPRTIRDAIDLTHRLGHRYLWVDKLCIIQDDMEEKKSQIQAMRGVYAGAYLTIIAAQGSDASQPLYPDQLDTTDAEVICVQQQLQYGRKKQLFGSKCDQTGDHHGEDSQMQSSTWYSRGWTFQEYLFSPRRLVFNGNTVNWECHCAAWHENQQHITARQCYHNGTNDVLGVDTTAWPNLYRLVRIICLFNRRFLTRPEDVLDAFEGPLLSFRSVFYSGFIAGLPQMFFDAALLWQPYSSLTRRKHYEESSTPDTALPSWSWIGWQGNLHSESWLACFDYAIQVNNWSGAIVPSSTRSTVTWSWSTSTNGPAQPVIVSADEFRKKYSDRHEPLPEGWSHSGDNHFLWHNPDKFEPFQYSLPNNYQPFKYPIPMMDSNSQLSPSIRAGFLHCRTRCTILKVGNLLRDIPSVRHGCVTAILVRGDAVNTSVGYLRLNEDPDAAETQVGDVCELIELSSGEQENGLRHAQTLDWEGGKSFLDMESFFNVMWIEWKDNVAYRKAVGRVRESVWRDVETEEVDITLG
ncbi:HET-domain-containing protein [Rhizodiscina lignyota]|uniref:HET-domain-containing protein n=1 Tax=Rhizodiscina lignyota TaxID=1504668 RepID=A0A9P4M4L4_9PEZI|nr:HET-domain-containing protein [Rhizodiscina lignyota]